MIAMIEDGTVFLIHLDKNSPSQLGFPNLLKALQTSWAATRSSSVVVVGPARYLSKQLALLIMDDEEEFPAQCPLLPAQELPYMPQIMMPPSYGYEVSFKRESKGTGVFIPQSTAPRRKNRSRRQTTVDSHPKRQLNNILSDVSMKPSLQMEQPAVTAAVSIEEMKL
ncbi:hypothetical protein OPV22_006750 [Ensete ventricosum]|uniref:Uncharacterized protein n=1 Tax=Ensete ventricosum TaxID=4639 RepID=A0AAV8RT43_ENSVE|nr:hypothetical protein OPV22_006750 [Ensete ventricosum]